MKRRIRRNRFLRGAAWGLAAGAGAALIVRIIALFTPVADKWLWAVLPAAGFALLFAAGNALRPVKDLTAAEAADSCAGAGRIRNGDLRAAAGGCLPGAAGAGRP